MGRSFVADLKTVDPGLGLYASVKLPHLAQISFLSASFSFGLFGGKRKKSPQVCARPTLKVQYIYAFSQTISKVFF